MSEDLLTMQAEECEALHSIYEGDPNFKAIDSKTFQYKYGLDGDAKSFLVEIKWGDKYPEEVPAINMDAFYNRSIVSEVKKKIHDTLSQEALQWLGCGMTYTLFECIKDTLDDLTADQPTNKNMAIIDMGNTLSTLKLNDQEAGTAITTENDAKKKEIKREILTKAQKRRQWERTDHKGERPRGWDWVDIVKHLSQTGSKDDGTPNAAIQPTNC